MRRRIGCIEVICGVLAVWGGTQAAVADPAGAGEAGSAIEEIVVTASRAGRDAQSEPAAVHRIDAQQKTTAAATRTTPDLLEGVPSVMVQKTALGQGSPYLRGFTGFRTLALVDGIRLNNSVFRDGPNQYWNTIDPLTIRTCEVVLGPGSVLYGSDAIGGVVTAIPVRPPDYDGAPAWRRRVFYRGSTAERSNVGRVEVGGRPDEHWGFVAGVSLKDFGDLEGGDEVGRQEHTGYDEQDYDGRLDYHFSKDARLTLAHQTVVQDDAWRTHRTAYGIDWEGLKSGDDKVHSFDQRRDLTYLRQEVENIDGFVDRLQWTLSRQAMTEDLYRVKKDDKAEKQGFDVETWGGSVVMESEGWAGRWVYGAEYYRDLVNTYGRKYKADGTLERKEIQGPVADEATYDTVGVFVQDTIPALRDAIEITPGVRYTYAGADADRVKDPVSGKPMSVSDEWDTLTGSLRMLVSLSEDRRLAAYGGVSQGFRAPNLSDLSRFDLAEGGEIETPSPDLDPEQFVAFEIGLKSRTERLTWQLGYYYTVIDQMIVRTPTGRVVDDLNEVTKRNSGDGYVQGVELSGRWTVGGGWSTWLAACWMDGEVDAYPTSEAEAQRDHLSRLMPPTGQIGLRWETDSGRWWAEVVGDLADDADQLSAGDRRDTQRIPSDGTPGYAVCTVRTGTRIVSGLDLAVALENVFDEDYRIHGSGINEPGRNLILTANFAF